MFTSHSVSFVSHVAAHTPESSRGGAAGAVRPEGWGSAGNGRGAGPLQEGGAIDITCSVAGGDPPPSVVWRRDGEVSHRGQGGDTTVLCWCLLSLATQTLPALQFYFSGDV